MYDEPVLPEIATAPFDCVVMVILGPAMRKGVPSDSVCSEPESLPVTTNEFDAVTGPENDAVLIQVNVPEATVAPTSLEVLEAVNGPLTDPEANIDTFPRKFVVPNTEKLLYAVIGAYDSKEVIT